MSPFRRSFRDGDSEVWVRVRSDEDGLRLLVATDDAEVDVALPTEVAAALAAALTHAVADRPEHPSGPQPPGERASAGVAARRAVGRQVVGPDPAEPGHAELHLVRSDTADAAGGDGKDDTSDDGRGDGTAGEFDRPETRSEPVDDEAAAGWAPGVDAANPAAGETDEGETPFDEALRRLRHLARVLPETREVFVLDAPTFRVATKMFAAVEVHDGTPVVRFKADIEHQAELCADERFVADVDTGQHGWTNVRADALGDDQFEQLIEASYRLVAPGDLVAELDARLATGDSER